MITECYVDGSYKPNGSAAAVIIYRNRKEVFKTTKPVPAKSSIVAECEAIILAVNLCWVSNYTMPTIFTDSASIWNAFYGHSKIRNKNLAFYIHTLREYEKRFGFTLVKVKRGEVFVPDDMCSIFIKTAHQFFETITKDLKD